MTHTHKDITHPELRARMAAALNRLRHPYRLGGGVLDLSGIWFESHRHDRVKIACWIGRRAAQLAVYEMARLEQALDTAQDAAIVSDYCAAHPVSAWWPTGYPDIAPSTVKATEPQGIGGQ